MQERWFVQGGITQPHWPDSGPSTPLSSRAQPASAGGTTGIYRQGRARWKGEGCEEVKYTEPQMDFWERVADEVETAKHLSHQQDSTWKWCHEDKWSNDMPRDEDAKAPPAAGPGRSSWVCEDRAGHALPPVPACPKGSGSTRGSKQGSGAAIPPWKGLLDCWARVRCSSLSRYTGWCWLISTLVHTLLSPCRKKVNEQDKCSLQRQQQKVRLKCRISKSWSLFKQFEGIFWQYIH